MASDPIHQFEIHSIVPIAKIGGVEIHFTNSALFMVITVAITALLLLGTTGSRRLVPTRMQSLAEMSYEFVANTLRSTAGEEGMKFFPLVFSLFMFILVSNVVGLIPYMFTVASQIIVTVALALLVFFTVIIYGFYRNGLGFFRLFVPHGIPIYILPLIVFIEVLSFLSRPISHSVRLFANMLAGHITLKVFAGFVTMLGRVRLRRLGRRRAAARRSRSRSPRSSSWSRSCRPTCSPSSPASISTMLFTRAIEARILSQKEFCSWIRLPRSTLGLALPASGWAAPAPASASSSAAISPPRCAIRRPPRVSSAT